MIAHGDCMNIVRESAVTALGENNHLPLLGIEPESALDLVFHSSALVAELLCVLFKKGLFLLYCV